MVDRTGYLLNTSCVPGPVLGLRDTVLNKTEEDHVPALVPTLLLA